MCTTMFAVSAFGLAPNNAAKKACIEKALGKGALSGGIDSIGLIPEAGGIARIIGHGSGFVGVAGGPFKPGFGLSGEDMRPKLPICLRDCDDSMSQDRRTLSHSAAITVGNCSRRHLPSIHLKPRWNVSDRVSSCASMRGLNAPLRYLLFGTFNRPLGACGAPSQSGSASFG